MLSLIRPFFKSYVKHLQLHLFRLGISDPEWSQLITVKVTSHIETIKKNTSNMYVVILAALANVRQPMSYIATTI